MNVAMMEKILLVKNYIILCMFCFVAITSFSQGRYDSYESQFESLDTSYTIRMSCYTPTNRWRLGCTQTRSASHLMKFEEKEDFDSLQVVMQSILKPLIGDKITNRLFFESFKEFNQDTTTYRDSVEIKRHMKYSPVCYEVRYEFETYFMFNDSIWFPMTFYIGLDDKLMDATTMISTLKSMDSFDLLPREEVYKKVSKNAHFKKYRLDDHFSLNYSENLKLFYYEFSAWDGVVLENEWYGSKTEINHMFIDAFTGRMLWKPTLVHEHETVGCVISWDILYPKNTLTGHPGPYNPEED